jgi:hypothetical protein
MGLSTVNKPFSKPADAHPTGSRENESAHAISNKRESDQELLMAAPRKQPPEGDAWARLHCDRASEISAED